jgi:hypothetical protein
VAGGIKLVGGGRLKQVNILVYGPDWNGNKPTQLD